MSMKGLEADKPAIAKSESAAPQFNVMQLMEGHRNLRTEDKTSRDDNSKQHEYLNKTAIEKIDNRPTSTHLDFGTSADLYGEHATHLTKHAAHRRHHAPAHTENVITEGTWQETKELHEYFRRNGGDHGMTVSQKDMNELRAQCEQAYRTEFHLVDVADLK